MSAADGVRLGAIAARLLRPQMRALLRAGGGLDESSTPEALHRLRVRAKKLRYALEPLRAVGGKPARRMLRRLERVQERVGMYHDTVTAIGWLRAWAGETRDAAAGNDDGGGRADPLVGTQAAAVARAKPQGLAPRADGRNGERPVDGTQPCGCARAPSLKPPPLVLVPARAS